MRSPQDMRVIQIEVTNACVRECSNCTRFCGHHHQPFFMDEETFRRAVDSLDGFEHCIGMMGGEPTLHPSFAKYASYLAARHRPTIAVPVSGQPVVDFPGYIRDRNFMVNESLNGCKGIGLWTSVTRQYYENFELIQELFNYQSLNDHKNPSLHQPLLASRRELGIDDEKWRDIRDGCLIQNMWSASITPKGAFFCEVAAALDMLFDGPGGWPLEAGWWKRQPEDFGNQLDWCEICGGALFHSGRLASDEIDDVSPLLYRKLQDIGSPKVRAGRVAVMDMAAPLPGQAMPDTKNRYLPDFKARVAVGNDILFPQGFTGLIFCRSAQRTAKRLATFRKHFSRLVLFAVDKQTAAALSKYSAADVLCLSYQQGQTFGDSLTAALAQSGSGWQCLLEDDAFLPRKLTAQLAETVLNPGMLYSVPHQTARFFHPKAAALTGRTAEICRVRSCQEFYHLWPKRRRLALNPAMPGTYLPDGSIWDKASKAVAGTRQEKARQAWQKIKKDHEPLLTVHVSVFNLAHYIRPCLDSILSQDFDDYELLLVDNGSTDESIAICEEYVRLYPGRIRYKKFPLPTVIGRPYAYARKMAFGRYFMSVDGDDYLLPGSLQQIARLIAAQAPDVIVGAFRTETEAGCAALQDTDLGGSFVAGGSADELLAYIAARPNFHTMQWRFILRRKLLRHYGEKMLKFARHYVKLVNKSYYGDAVTAIAILGGAQSLAIMSEPFYVYRCRKASLSIQLGNKRPGSFLALLLVIGGWLKVVGKRRNKVFAYAQIRKFCTFFADACLQASTADYQEMASMLAAYQREFLFLCKSQLPILKELQADVSAKGILAGLREFVGRQQASLRQSVAGASGVYIFPTGVCAEAVAAQLASMQVPIKGFLDNDAAKEALKFGSYDCMLPDRLAVLPVQERSAIAIVIATSYDKLVPQLCRQLADLGIAERQIVVRPA